MERAYRIPNYFTDSVVLLQILIDRKYSRDNLLKIADLNRLSKDRALKYVAIPCPSRWNALDFYTGLVEQTLMFEFPITVLTELMIFHDSFQLQAVINEANDLFNQRPTKNNGDEQIKFMSKRKRSLRRLEQNAFCQAINSFSNQDDPRFLLTNEINSINQQRAEHDSRWQQLVEKQQEQFNQFSQAQQNQVLQAYYVISDMSRIMLDLSLGDISHNRHSFRNFPKTYFNILLYLNRLFYTEHSDSKLISNEILGRIIASLEVNQSFFDPNLDPQQLAHIMTAYANLLVSIEDCLFLQATPKTMPSSQHEFDIAFVKQQYLAQLIKPRGYPSQLSRVALYPKLVAGKDPTNNLTSLLISAIGDTNFGWWLWNNIKEEYEQKKTGDQIHDSRFKQLVMEMSPKSLLSILFLSGKTYFQQLQDYDVDTSSLYNVEIIPALLKTIIERDKKRIMSVIQSPQSNELLRFRIFANK